MTSTHINLRIIGANAYITVPASAMTQLGLGDGDQVLELVLDGLLVYIPVTADVTDAHDRFVHALDARGLTAEDLIADIEQHKDEVYEALYGASAS